MLETLIELNVNITALLTQQSSQFNTDHIDLKPFCDAHGIPCAYSGIYLDETALHFLKKGNPEIIFCLGWSALLPRDILRATPQGIVGFHPAPLPIGRGRHPLIWALVLGLPETASTFFFMDEGADSGDIISQQKVNVLLEDNAASLYTKTIATARQQLREFVPRMQSGIFEATPQDHSQATHWRKRDIRDGRVDFRMSADNIYNLVRALASPYPGAHVEYAGRKITIWRALPVPNAERQHEPGKILAVENNNTIIVKCGENAIRLINHAFTEIPTQESYLL
jgi:methionyl-tRNA formyltransferase